MNSSKYTSQIKNIVYLKIGVKSDVKLAVIFSLNLAALPFIKHKSPCAQWKGTDN